VVNSSATQEKVSELYDARNYPIIPMGINTSLFSPSSNKMRNNVFQIIFVGRAARVKGPIYLCKAIRLLVNEGRRNLSLKIVGTGPELSNLKRYVARNNLKKYITFTGWVAHKELPKYYNSADVLVAPSIITTSGSREAFGLALAEALACGTPVIGTKVGGTKDIVADKINGYLVVQKNESEIASAITELMDNPVLATIMGNKGRTWVIKNFSWAVVVKKYRAVFNNVL
jgi:glycosyltransferase involved in cell wall biosynthesis